MTLGARLLEHLAPWRTAPAWRVALSGGLDSTVLLHLLARLAQSESIPPVSAIHIHHGLQAAADAWPEHCRALCAALNVPLDVLHVQVAPGASLEQAARNARYQALAGQVAGGEVLLVAQHQDDQAETLLFRLVRGAGVQGLAAMPATRPIGNGHLVRPMLAFSRAELLAYAQTHGLRWVDDPSNSDERFSRNYLRHQVMPQLEKRWPHVSGNLARAAELLSEAGQLLDEMAAQDLLAAQVAPEVGGIDIPALSLPVLSGLSEVRQRNALRYWLRPLTRMPVADHWAGWIALRDAARDASPIWQLESGQVRRSNDYLWWLSGDWLVPVPAQEWPLSGPGVLELPGNGRIIVKGTLPDGECSVGYRRAGEAIQIPGRGRRDIKRLFNEWRIPAFVRDRLPLMRCDGNVVAIANMPGLQLEGGESCLVSWIAPTSDQGLS